MKVLTFVKTGLYMSRLVVSLLFVWLTFGWKVRKARKVFEKELLKNGVPREAAKVLTKKYSSVKPSLQKFLSRPNLAIDSLKRLHV